MHLLVLDCFWAEVEVHPESVQAAVEDWRTELDGQFARRVAELEAEWAGKQPELERQML